MADTGKPAFIAEIKQAVVARIAMVFVGVDRRRGRGLMAEVMYLQVMSKSSPMGIFEDCGHEFGAWWPLGHVGAGAAHCQVPIGSDRGPRRWSFAWNFHRGGRVLVAGAQCCSSPLPWERRGGMSIVTFRSGIRSCLPRR